MTPESHVEALSRERAALEHRIADLRRCLDQSSEKRPRGFVAGLITGTLLCLAVFVALAMVVTY